jgi:hypothetical protein
VSSTPYDASEHLYLRISADEQGQISCSAWNGTSMVDGGPQWKPLGTLDKAAVPPPSSVQIAVVGGAGNFEIGDVGAQPGAAGPAKGARWCPVSALVDRFDDGIVPGPLWGTSNFGGGTADEDAGALTCHPDKALDSIEYLSSAAYDLTDGTLSIRLGSIPSGYVAQFGVRNDRAADYHDRSYTAHAELLVHSPDDGLKNAFAGCDAEGKPLPLPSWIRLRHRADAGASLLAFEYSDGGGAWTALTTCDTPGLDVSRVDVHLKATGPNGGTGTVVFDDCNAAP